jgi:hypothetical protein
MMAGGPTTGEDPWPTFAPPADVPDGIRRARAALRRDLPALLADRQVRGKWVCYGGDTRIGIGTDYTALIRECVRRGIPDDQFVVERVTPRAGGEEEEEIESRGD